MADPLRLALDQNFPLSVLKMAPALPDDRSLVIALYQLGWVGLVTNNGMGQDHGPGNTLAPGVHLPDGCEKVSTRNPARTAGFLVNTSLHAHVNLVFGPRPAGTETGRAGTLWLMNRRE